MHKVLKVKIPFPEEDTKVEVPYRAEFLKCEFQMSDSKDLSVWFICNPDLRMGTRTLKIFGTGWDIPTRIPVRSSTFTWIRCFQGSMSGICSSWCRWVIIMIMVTLMIPVETLTHEILLLPLILCGVLWF